MSPPRFASFIDELKLMKQPATQYWSRPNSSNHNNRNGGGIAQYLKVLSDRLLFSLWPKRTP